MKVLVLGSGGRESALCWALARAPSVADLHAAPGNPGIAELATVHSADIVDAGSVLALARRLAPDLVVVGPEAPLVAGIGDALRSERIAVFGPDAAAARLEGSKSHAKQLMASAGIATARAETFDSSTDAVSFMDQLGPPYVVKADGLAAGKGVVVTDSRAEAITAIEERVVLGKFGDAGSRVVIEEFLEGEEVSLIAFADGAAAVPCEPAQDYKRALDGDRGPNTGGMGSYSPVPSCPSETAERVVEEVLEPIVRTMAQAGTPFVGALYAGLALTDDGPKVVEFNARFGDPETQALLPRLRSDLGELAMACADGSLAGVRPEWSSDVCVSVVLASGGYPGDYQTGVVITGIDEARRDEGVEVFHAGTATRDGAIVTAGGRVLNVTALGDGFDVARQRAYEAADKIAFDGKHFREDIAQRAERATSRT